MSLPGPKWPEHGARINFDLLDLVAESMTFTEKVTSLNEMEAFAAAPAGVAQPQGPMMLGPKVGREFSGGRAQGT